MDPRAFALIALLFVACVPQALVEAAKDRDRDGFIAWQLGGPDCDDADASVHPDANEVCGDGVDNDCDGVIDDDGVGALQWYPDRDGDGFGVDEPVSACARPEGHVGSLANGIDCDDTRDWVHPGALDVWYDGVDANCDEADDYDQDGDGYRALGEHPDGDDCDDTNHEVNPGEVEVCGNLLDDDCDGTSNDCDWAGLLTPSQVRAGMIDLLVDLDDFPRVLLADLTGNGHPEVVVTTRDGRLLAYTTPINGTVGPSAAFLTLQTYAPPESIPADVEPHLLPDVDGDGAPELVLDRRWTNQPGDVLVFNSPHDGVATTADADHRYVVAPGPNGTTYLPNVLWAGELDPGSPGLLVIDNPNGNGAILADPLPEDGDLHDVANGTFGSTVTGRFEGASRFQDFDEDGVDDFTFTYYDTGSQRWRALVYAGGEATSVSSVLGEFTATDGVVPILLATTRDFDQDGFLDPCALTLTFGEGTSETSFSCVSGPIDFSEDFSDPDFVFRTGPVLNAMLGYPALGDVNGDGAADVVLLTMLNTDGTPRAEVSVFYGPIAPGDRVVTDADVRITLAQDRIGSSLLRTADLDRDGYDDIVLTGPRGALILYGQGR